MIGDCEIRELEKFYFKQLPIVIQTFVIFLSSQINTVLNYFRCEKSHQNTLFSQKRYDQTTSSEPPFSFMLMICPKILPFSFLIPFFRNRNTGKCQLNSNLTSCVATCWLILRGEACGKIQIKNLKTSIKSEPISILRNKTCSLRGLFFGFFLFFWGFFCTNPSSLSTAGTDAGWLGDVCVGE